MRANFFLQAKPGKIPSPSTVCTIIDPQEASTTPSTAAIYSYSNRSRLKKFKHIKQKLGTIVIPKVIPAILSDAFEWALSFVIRERSAVVLLSPLHFSPFVALNLVLWLCKPTLGNRSDLRNLSFHWFLRDRHGRCKNHFDYRDGTFSLGSYSCEHQQSRRGTRFSGPTTWQSCWRIPRTCFRRLRLSHSAKSHLARLPFQERCWKFWVQYKLSSESRPRWSDFLSRLLAKPNVECSQGFQ